MNISLSISGVCGLYFYTREKLSTHSETYKKVQSISTINNPSHTVVKKQGDTHLFFDVKFEIKLFYAVLYHAD